MIQVKLTGYHYFNLAGLQINRPEGSGDYLLLYFRCPLEVFMNGDYQPVAAGHFMLYKKGAPQIYRKMDDLFVNDWIHFDFSSYDDYFERLGIPFSTPIALSNNKLITDMMADIYIEFYNEGEQHDSIMDYKMNALFHKFSDMYRLGQTHTSAADKYYNQLARIRREILDFQYMPSGVEDVAGRMNLSTSYLQHLYKETFDTSLHQDIIRGRIKQAAQLLELREDSVSISEIAAECGYDNLEHFSRQFKKIIGMPPSKYRNNKRGKVNCVHFEESSKRIPHH